MCKLIFLVLFFTLTFVPLLSEFGFQERFVSIAGREPESNVPAISRETWMMRQFQKQFEETFARRFYLRKTFLTTRYQLYDWLNFGLFHEGYSGNIIEGKAGVLFERPYLQFYADVRTFNPTKKDDAIVALTRIARACKQLNVDFCVVFAPDKVQMCYEYLPCWSSLALVDQIMFVQRECEDLLSKADIPFFPALDFLTKYQQSAITKRGFLFPVAGSHWNARSANLVIKHYIESLNEEGGRIKYRIRDFCGVAPTKESLYNDTDLGLLMNLIDQSKVRNNENLIPVFRQQPFKPNDGSALIVGDSYTIQIAQAIKDSCLFDPSRVFVCDNRHPTSEELKDMAGDLRMLMLVMMPINAYQLFEIEIYQPTLRMIASWLEETAAQRGGISRQLLLKSQQ